MKRTRAGDALSRMLNSDRHIGTVWAIAFATGEAPHRFHVVLETSLPGAHGLGGFVTTMDVARGMRVASAPSRPRASGGNCPTPASTFINRRLVTVTAA